MDWKELTDCNRPHTVVLTHNHAAVAKENVLVDTVLFCFQREVHGSVKNQNSVRRLKKKKKSSVDNFLPWVGQIFLLLTTF